MYYSNLVETYEKLEKTTKKLEKTKIIAELLVNVPEKDIERVVFLLQGNVFPKWDERKIGMSSKLVAKAINSATGALPSKIEKEWARKGDLGIVVEELISKHKQTALFSEKLTIEKVFDNIRKLAELEGTGTVSKKIQLVTELLTSANPKEAKFIARTIIEDLRIGVKEGIIRDAIVWAYFPRIKGINDYGKEGKVKKIKKIEELDKLNLKKYDIIEAESEKLARECYNYFVKKIEHAYNVVNDFAIVAKAAKSMKLEELSMVIGKPINPMLAIRVESFKEALKVVGSPALCEVKLDGFRLQIHKDGDDIKLFTRRLENVTNQFRDVIQVIKKNVKCKKCILDSELVGYDPKTKKHLPFQYISQRIKRKYDIEKLSKEMPVEINVFDILNKEGEILLNKTKKKRRKILEGVIKEEKLKIVLTKKLVSGSEKEMEKLYKESLKAGNEGIMVKNLKSAYIPGRRVGGWVKIKPVKESLDLVIVGAEWGEGKRANWLASFTLACRDKNKLLTIGKVGTGIAEKGSGVTFETLTKELKPLIKEEKGKHVSLKPKLILEIGYEEIQKSPTYGSGYALRFPKVLRVRKDLGFSDIDDINRVERIFNKQKKKRQI